MISSILLLNILCSLIVRALGQDPANGWMAYAVGAIPEGKERITRLEMTWTISEEASRSRAFYSPWFGMDPGDNLNLIQPVNPWTGSEWTYYTEYFQWKPTHNSNSKSYPAKGGQTLHGSLIYDAGTDAYFLNQTLLETGESSTQTVPCQDGKKYTLPYIVYEKTFPCSHYPPDGIVIFKDIYAECDGSDCTNDIKWEAKVKDPNCDMKANIIDANTISITWDVNAKSVHDNKRWNELVFLNSHGWAKDYFTAGMHDNVDQLFFITWSSPMSSPNNPMALSQNDRKLSIQFLPNEDRANVKSINVKFENKDGYIGAETSAFVWSEIWYQSYTATVHFDKKAPTGTYSAAVTVNLHDGSSYTYDHLEDTYWRNQRNLYAIEYVESTEDIKKAKIELTSLDFPETVAWADNEFTFTVGFKSPIGLYQGLISIAPINHGSDTSLLCTSQYWNESGIKAIQLQYEEANQVDGTFTEGKYQTKCIFEKGYNEPGDFTFTVQLVNMAREDAVYTPQELTKMGFKSTVTVTA